MFHVPNFRGRILKEQTGAKRVLLHFGAVDYNAKVWVNGQYAVEHKGGNTPFYVEISRLLNEGENRITVRVQDSYSCTQPRGKQDWKEKPNRIRYTNTTGIWQSVWLEAIGAVCLEKLRFTPDLDRKKVYMDVHFDGSPFNMELDMEIRFKGRTVERRSVLVQSPIIHHTLDLAEVDPVLDQFQSWSPDRPNLYDIIVTLSKEGEVLDRVASYFALRKVSVRGDEILLNNMPLYQKLVLDQGYWEESLMTPPSDEAIIRDIEMVKKMGFNGVRKHQKVEDPRFYYWADRMGLLVWAEMPSAYQFNTAEIENITKEWLEFINRDYNHPCIITWVPLNESWGVKNILTDKRQQAFAKSLYYLTQCMDGTRLVSSNDGWEQVADTDICGLHDYAPWGDSFEERYKEKSRLMKSAVEKRLSFCDGEEYNGQPVLITEYGGIAFESDQPGHWGYHGAVKDGESFMKRFASVTSAIRKIPYIRGYCYTQLTDTFQEANGLLTMDRRCKVNLEAVAEVNRNS